MAEITIEPGGVKTAQCTRCGRDAAVAHGYVYANGDAHAIYFVDWCEHHEQMRSAFLTLAIGDWDEGSSSANRQAVCVQVRPDGMSLTEQPARDRPAFFGRFLPTTLALPLVDSLDVWHLADHIVLDDPLVASVMSWVRSESETALSRAGSD